MTKERDFYPSISDWFESKKDCKSTKIEHPFDNLRLLTGDVVGWSSDHIYACELKLYPFPVGSQGYGAVGQALALRSYADIVYVGCVSSDRLDDEQICWRVVSELSTVIALIDKIGVSPPETFDEYCNVAIRIYNRYFGRLGLGFLVVHEHLSGEKDIQELVAPNPGKLIV